MRTSRRSIVPPPSRMRRSARARAAGESAAFSASVGVNRSTRSDSPITTVVGACRGMTPWRAALLGAPRRGSRAARELSEALATLPFPCLARIRDSMHYVNLISEGSALDDEATLLDTEMREDWLPLWRWLLQAMPVPAPARRIVPLVPQLAASCA